MKYILTQTYLACGLLAHLTTAAIDHTCTDLEVKFDGAGSPIFLTAKCQNRENTATQCSELNLNLCYRLQLGSSVDNPSIAVGSNGGNFGRYCTDCGATNSPDPTVKYCTCVAYEDNGKLIYGEVEIDLNEGTIIQDSNGFLQCFDHTAAAMDNC
ncbi:hypothetical protein M406DRAFT_70801 [Cryphonectria parasitica EP155]|uniref:Cyanovirin-N domain-containing protein n=1 Tax=Cryphonectria parasitica (strain ATCC 38755 / EP155) TaxID=660469 RepID=A0A9P5CNT9_CRYP1|nr:uncharacterized protein M406DRAFT_70801 [Cryphonectria parasitica EP155]KAF3764672.1 hypothetical protein M406DRAFT_70801 [Cryphonectria parasitica EP155]